MSIDPDDILTQLQRACAYSQLGELEPAFDMLERFPPHANHETKSWTSSDRFRRAAQSSALPRSAGAASIGSFALECVGGLNGALHSRSDSGAAPRHASNG